MSKKRSKNERRERRRYQVESLESRLVLASDWTNPIDIFNVDGTNETVESVTPLDALLVINELNDRTVSGLDGSLPELTEQDESTSVYFDVNGDGYVSPIDAVMVVNKLNENQEVVEDNVSKFAASSVIAGSRAADHDAITEDTLVNTQTRFVQRHPSVASAPNGNSVIVWESFGNDGSGWGIFGQRFDASGAAVGSEFQVNTTTLGAQMAPDVAVGDDGSFVVVWHSVFGSDGNGFGVYSQEYDSAGNPVGGETQVNTTRIGTQFDPEVAFGNDGYTVVWQGRGFGDVSGVYAKTFTDGVAGSEVRVNTSTSGFQGAPTVAANASGSTVVAWQGKGPGDVYGIFMRDISVADSEQVLVNVDTSGLQHLPTIAINNAGQIAVAWHSPPDGVLARVFGDDGGSDVIQVSQTRPGLQSQPSIDLITGGVAVAWHGKGPGDHFGIFAREFATDGTATSDETLVNQTTTALQMRPSLAAANDGYIVSYQGRGEGDLFGTFARFFETEIAGPFSIDATADSSIDEGTTFTTTASVTDTDNNPDNVIFSLAAAPEGAVIDSNTGAITWATTESDGPGVFEFTVNATVGEFVSTDIFNVTVNEVNAVPVLAAISDLNVLVDNAFSLPVFATDADLPVQSLTFSASGLPGWLSFNEATQTFNGTPAQADEGTSTITVSVSDGNGGTDSQTFAITVTGNQAPVIAAAIADASANELEPLSLDISGSFSDPEGNAITYTASNLPGWATLNSETGVITGTPGNLDVETRSVTITATDSFGGQVSDTFNLTVIDANTFTPDALERSFRVAENAASGTEIGTITSFDLDPSSVPSYSLTEGNASGAFAIDSASGVVSVSDVSAFANLPVSNALTVTTSDGVNSSTSQLTIVRNNAAPQVGYSLQVVDPTTNEVLTTVTPGQTVDLVLNVQSIGADSNGVFSAYADIVFNEDTASVAGDIVHSATYGNGTFGDISVAGLINEAGGTDGLSELGDGVFEVLRVPMQIANLPVGSVVDFDTNDADAASIRATTAFGNNEEISPNDQSFSGTRVTVAAVDEVMAEEG